MTTFPATATPRRHVPPVVGVAMLCVVGAVAAASLVLVLGGDDGAPPPPGPAEAPAAAAGARLPTSFGSVSVDYVVRLTGSERPMGLQVSDGRAPVQIGLTVTNIEDVPVRVDRALISLSPAAPGGLDLGRLSDGVVPPLSAHRVVLRATVAEGTALPQVLVRDPARDAPLRAALAGRVGDLGTLDVSSHEFGAPVR